MARRRRSSLAQRLVVRPVKARIRKRKVARKRQQIAAAKAWQPIARNPKRGVKIPRAQGGGRLVKPTDLGISEAQWAKAKAAIKAREKAQRAPARASAARKLAPAKAAGIPHTTRIAHGTNAGYHAHLANNSPACPPCLKAHAAYNRAHREGTSMPTPKKKTGLSDAEKRQRDQSMQRARRFSKDPHAPEVKVRDTKTGDVVAVFRKGKRVTG